MSQGLRLGPILEDKPVKVTVELSSILHAQLSEYAELHARENGIAAPLPPERLIAPMLGRFIATDRAFARLRKR